MGLGIYPVFNPPNRSANFDHDGKFLLRAIDGLEEIAVSHGITSISAFMDDREVPEGFEGDPDDLREFLGPWDAWFSIDEGLRCVEGLAQILQIDAIARSFVENPDEVVEELVGLAHSLRRADETASSFCLEFD